MSMNKLTYVLIYCKGCCIRLRIYSKKFFYYQSSNASTICHVYLKQRNKQTKTLLGHQFHTGIIFSSWFHCDEALSPPTVAPSVTLDHSRYGYCDPITSTQGSHNSHGNQFLNWLTSQSLQPNECVCIVDNIVVSTISDFYPLFLSHKSALQSSSRTQK